MADNLLIVFDRKTRVHWAQVFSAPIPRYTADELKWRLGLIDLHGNGNRGVLFATQFLDLNQPNQLLYFSSEARLSGR